MSMGAFEEVGRALLYSIANMFDIFYKYVFVAHILDYGFMLVLVKSAFRTCDYDVIKVFIVSQIMAL